MIQLLGAIQHLESEKFIDLKNIESIYGTSAGAIVGTLIHIGRNRWAANDMRRIIQSGRRSEAGETAPPQGLYLMQVDYDIKKTEDHSEASRDPAKTR